jgi:hypothetical protein
MYVYPYIISQLLKELQIILYIFSFLEFLYLFRFWFIFIKLYNLYMLRIKIRNQIIFPLIIKI